VKLSKTLVLPVAGLLLVAAAGVALATSGSPATGASDLVVPAADTPTPTPAASTAPVQKDTLLSGVLDELVTKGTISAAQKTAILDALQTERTARQTLRKQEAQQLKDFLSDGVITQDELNQLPADSPIRKLTGLLDDGKITIDELRGLRGILGGGRGGFGGRGFGHGGGMWAAPYASPAPSASTGG
jgi:polyhydroxyalkanoate synthesis regulator phasin